MSQSGASSFLRRALVADAAVSGAAALVMALDADALQGMLAVPAVLLRGAGIALVPFVALVVYLAARERVSQAGVRAVIALNAGWVAASVLLLVSGRIEPNGLGAAFILGQALAVAVLAEIQHAGLRRAAASLA